MSLLAYQSGEMN